MISVIETEELWCAHALRVAKAAYIYDMSMVEFMHRESAPEKWNMLWPLPCVLKELCGEMGRVL